MAVSKESKVSDLPQLAFDLAVDLNPYIADGWRLSVSEDYGMLRVKAEYIHTPTGISGVVAWQAELSLMHSEIRVMPQEFLIKAVFTRLDRRRIMERPDLPCIKKLQLPLLGAMKKGTVVVLVESGYYSKKVWRFGWFENDSGRVSWGIASSDLKAPWKEAAIRSNFPFDTTGIHLLVNQVDLEVL